MRAIVSAGVLLAVLLTGWCKVTAAPFQADEKRATDLEVRLTAIAIPEMIVPVPKGTNRVTAAALFQPTTASPGDTVTLLVKVRVAAGHWIYALEDSGSSNVPTTLTTPLPRPPFRLSEPWRGPQPKVKSDGSRVYAGELVFQSRFQIERGAAEAIQKLPVTLKYQVCNEALCWPPATISLEPALKVVWLR